MRGFVVAIVVMLFALIGAQSSAHAQTIVRAHVNAIAAFDPNVVDDASVNDASASPREAPQGAALIDPADDRGAEVRARGPMERSAHPRNKPAKIYSRSKEIS